MMATTDFHLESPGASGQYRTGKYSRTTLIASCSFPLPIPACSLPDSGVKCTYYSYNLNRLCVLEHGITSQNLSRSEYWEKHFTIPVLRSTLYLLGATLSGTAINLSTILYVAR